jgi:tetratricopeptide (TPR) repeat protein
MGDTRSFAGTIPYMSPEQLRGEQADPRNDIYAAGIVLYEMACGQRPFPQTQSAELIAAILNSMPSPPSSINHDISTDFDAVVLKAIDKQPAKRYQSATAIVPDLQQLRLPSLIPARLPRMSGWAAALICIALILMSAQFWGHGILHWPRARASYVAPMFPGTPPQSQGKYLAVLPFNISGEAAPVREYLADGLSDGLSARLFRLKGLRLASQTAVAKASRTDSIQKAANQLGVNLIVGGTIEADIDKITVSVNLLEPANSRKLWTQKFIESPKDLLTLEDQIVSHLVTALQINPSKTELAQIAERPTNNADAYLLYLRGRQALRGPEGGDSAQFAIEFFERGIHEDPGFALAYAGLADANLMLYAAKKEPRFSRRALDAAERAVQINDSLPAAHIALGNVYLKIGKKTEAIAELKRVVQLAPSFDNGYFLLGNAYLDAGQKDEAIATYKRAIEVDPYYWSNHIALGNAYYSIGETEKAVEEYKRVTELEPENPVGWDNLGNAYLRQGKYEESIPAYKKSIEISPNWSAYNNLGYVYLVLKRYSEAVQMSEKAIELAPTQELAVGNLADAYRGAGQKDKADATYDKAIALALVDLKKHPREAFVLEDLALYNAKKGDAVRGLDFIRRARSIDKNDIELIYAQALVETLANRRTDALRTFREAVEKGYPIKQIGDDPELTGLHNSPEFEQLWNEYYHKSK